MKNLLKHTKEIIEGIYLGLVVKTVTFYIIILLLLTLTRDIFGADKRKFNVLFIAVDDLNTKLGCYGAIDVVTPNIDRLARNGVVFTSAYCQLALCCPSRTSLLTGLRPDSTQVYGNSTHFRKTIPNVVTLPEYFKANGYYTRALGKIYHGGFGDPQSWSVPSEAQPKSPEPQVKRVDENMTGDKKRKKQASLLYEAPDVPDEQCTDGAIARRAIEVLNEIKNIGQSFFLAVGFLKPHFPYVAPKKYWDLYLPEKLKLAENTSPPEGAPSCALAESSINKYPDMPKERPVPKEEARKLIHGYYACVSFMDAQVGKVVDELERLGLKENTIIILWGDNGWHLGDHGLWCKLTNYENSVHIPLIISVPGKSLKGIKCNALVELVDIYPSLCELCNLPLPSGLEGISFAPLLENPKLPWKKAAFSQAPRNIPGQGKGMGYSIRTERYRYTEWVVSGKDFCEVELYDYKTDPKENTNIANRPENAKLLEELKEMLHKGWKNSLPLQK